MIRSTFPPEIVFKKADLKKNVEHPTSNIDEIVKTIFSRKDAKNAKKITHDIDELIKSRKITFLVIPAKAGIQYFQKVLDAGQRSRLQRGSSPA